MKRAICFLVAALLLSAAALADIPFTDVPETMWCFDAVCQMRDRGLMLGTGGNKFSPDQRVTRGMAAAVLYRLAGSPTCDAVGSMLFSDVREGAYYDIAVGWAQTNGIVFGYADGTFQPDGSVSRQQLMAMLYRYAENLGEFPVINYSIGHVADETDGIAPYAQEAMLWAEDNGVLLGLSCDDLAPQNNATRAQLAAFMARFIVEQSRQRITFYEPYDGRVIKGIDLISREDAERFQSMLERMDKAAGEYPEFIPRVEIRFGTVTYGFDFVFDYTFSDSSTELRAVRYHDSADESCGTLTTENEELRDELISLLLVEWMFFTAN